MSAAADEASGPDGLHMVLVGSVPALGCWDPSQGLRLAVDDAGMWRGRLELPMGYSVQAKVRRMRRQARFKFVLGKQIHVVEAGKLIRCSLFCTCLVCCSWLYGTV